MSNNDPVSKRKASQRWMGDLQIALLVIAIEKKIKVKATHDWPKWIDFQAIDYKLSKLTPEQIREFVIGKRDEELIKKYALHKLDGFFDSLYDGELNIEFFEY